MSQGVIARRYAKALLNLAENEKNLESTGESFSALAEVYADTPELREALSDTKVAPAVKQKILQDVLKKIKVPALVNTFSRYLLSKRRLVLLPEIERAFSLLLQERLGNIEATVTVARELSKEAVGELERSLSRYSGKNVTVRLSIDPVIIGGIVTRIGSVVLDGSLQTQLNQLQQTIQGASVK